MNSADKILIAAQHLVATMSILESIGADLTAAKLSSAMDSFLTEIPTIPLSDVTYNDASDLVAEVGGIFTDDSSRGARIPM